MKRARLIYNPTSGREEMRRRLPDILHRLDQGGIEASCHATMGEGDATKAAIDAVERGYDMIIAAGGDGTLYEVVNGMAERDNLPPLGVFPVGTTNDFARGLGIPRNWEDYCDLVIRQQTRPIDVGKANDRYFINIAGGGTLTELTYDVPSRLKTMIGQLAYYIKGVEKMVSLSPQELIINAEGQETIHDEFMIFLITNTNSVGGFEKLAPGARIDDGLLDVIALKKCNLAEFVRLVSLALRGEHFNDKKVVYFRTRSMEVTSPGKVLLNLDGELGGTLPGQFSVLPQHLRIFA
ncbi:MULTISPECIES: diacylglycerol kinase [Paenibacillus]|jgi:diacylglycerol kinase (ATP)|uniref:Lipid kinase n=3 Tax=Paenibacillus TaxID=44249 RepID=A0A1R1E185_9BACL|nr:MULTISPECIES: diacylglycerol kinase [Paenibacillus]MBJ9989338.1 diacylglycerol kinase [Paenibacillus sp. S28]MCM3001204.1 diacylglycerol kinase [Paenibacillus cellulositrophicus]MEC0179710.1 diacylglycerol kinase [Paenibacillus favisporus]OMF45551.1 lipid kinase [Paenibacillus rhizosphaerae]RED32125.1 diacylglycerol kinase (ATP) [Paenibacillus sp. VMFN-D1]